MADWTFAHVADIQVGSPRSFRFAPAWNENWATARRQIVERDPEFLLVGGDLTRDGFLHRYELEAIRRDLDDLPFPAHVIPGNMDAGNKHAHRQGPNPKRDDMAWNIRPDTLAQFESVFGPSHWSVVHRNVRVTAFCDMLLGSGLPEEDALWRWLETLADLPRVEHHLMMTHYALFIDAPDEAPFDIGDPDQYHAWYFSIDQSSRDRLLEIARAAGVERVVTGHIHRRRSVEIGGIGFDYAPATCMSQFGNRWPDADPTLGFSIYHVTDEGIRPEFVPLEETSEAEGYGPGGHPPAEDRDYSIAWDKESNA